MLRGRPWPGIVLAAVGGLLTACAVAPSMATAEQDVVCLTCGGDGEGGGVTHDQAVAVSTNWVAGTYQGSHRVSAGCDSIEIGGAVGYSCWVAFDFLGHRYTAQCTVWDNTSAGGATGTNRCGVEGS